MPDSSSKQALILRNFHDTGTEKKFKKGWIVPMNPGVFANYKAAGLVAEAPPTRKPESGDAPPATEIPPGDRAE